jgi:hypothetical protein
MIRRTLLLAAFAAGVAAPAFAETVKFHTLLTAAAEVPPTQSTGSGEASATLDTTTHVLSYEVMFGGFSSAATMAHFHGPAAAGVNAGIAVALGMDPTSPIKGSVTLTPAQEQQLLAGQWYVNVHTKNNPGGAIRGQMLPVK